MGSLPFVYEGKRLLRWGGGLAGLLGGALMLFASSSWARSWDRIQPDPRDRSLGFRRSVRRERWRTPSIWS